MPSLTARELYALWSQARAEPTILWEELGEKDQDTWVAFARLLRDLVRGG